MFCQVLGLFGCQLTCPPLLPPLLNQLHHLVTGLLLLQRSHGFKLPGPQLVPKYLHLHSQRNSMFHVWCLIIIQVKKMLQNCCLQLFTSLLWIKYNRLACKLASSVFTARMIAAHSSTCGESCVHVFIFLCVLCLHRNCNPSLYKQCTSL